MTGVQTCALPISSRCISIPKIKKHGVRSAGIANDMTEFPVSPENEPHPTVAPDVDTPTIALVGFVLLLFAPIVARVLQAAVSRRRETLADVSACQLTRYPPGLISALEKLRDDTTVTHAATTATAHMWIEQPLSGVGDGGRMARWNRMFDTHPPLDERIALLREL